VHAYVLGPPTDRSQLFKDKPTRKGRETYDEEATALAAAELAFFAAADMAEGRGADSMRPFDTKFQITPDQAESIDFYREYYFGSGTGEDAWRQIEHDWMLGAAQFALKLDNDTNNTSLALAFELADGRVLLFPADAQVGNWESWHANADGSPRTWDVDSRKVTAADLLKRTVLYKVGHHGSHNATLREKGLELMTDESLVAMVPVDEYIAHEKKGWRKMPFTPLMSRLKELARGRVLRGDESLDALRFSATSKHRDEIKAFLKHVSESDETITVTGKDGNPASRPLFVEYLVPA
jgi:hypothetical protein